jgi:biopolymer transport protein ExbD
MSRKRSIRTRGKRQKKEKVSELDITSLLDVLVILLVFLLKSYSATGELAKIPKGVTLPKSDSQTLNNPGVIVQASKSQIWVDDKEIEGQNINQKITNLYNILESKKQTVQNIQKSAKNAVKFTGKVNLVLDKDIKYNYLRSILKVAADAGYQTYQFIVSGQE